MRSVYYLNSHINLNTLDPVQWRTRLYSLVQYGNLTLLKATHYAVELLGPLESVHSQWNKANKTETLDLCQRKRSLAMRQGGILFWILEFISIFHHDEAGIFKCFCFIWKLWKRRGRYQLQFLTLPAASSGHAGGVILSLSDSVQLSIFKFCKVYVENCSPIVQAFGITLYKALKQLKRNFINL